MKHCVPCTVAKNVAHVEWTQRGKCATGLGWPLLPGWAQGRG